MIRIRKLLHLIALPLVVLGATAAVAATGPAPPGRLRLAGPRVSVSADHRVGEFVVARDPSDPRHLVAAGYDFDSSLAPAFCNIYVSTTAGRSWKTVELGPGDEGGWGGDPWVTIAPDGTVHLTCLTVSVVGGSTMYRYTSGDGGRTWSPAGLLPGIIDKESVLATRDGSLFACGSHLMGAGSSLAVIKSSDHGVTWSAPTFFEGLKNCNGMVEGPGSELHLNWLAIEGETRVVGTVTSLDGGTTWQPPTTLARHPYPNEFTNPDTVTNGTNTYTRPTDTWPAITVSQRTGAVFVADTRPDLDSGTTGMKLRVSADRGATYELVELPRVPTTLTQTETTRPALAVDDAGRLALQLVVHGGIAFSEREVWMLVSPDDGRTWLRPLLVASTDAGHTRYDPRSHAPNPDSLPSQALYTLQHPDYPDTTFVMTGTLAANSGQLDWGGDYASMTATPRGFVAMWQDFAAGGENRLYSRLVKVTR